MIVLRFLRTVAGWTAILFSTMAHALLIGLNGESDVSERLLRNWARLFLWVAGARVTVRYDAPLEKGRSYVFVSNHTSNLDAPAILSVIDHPLRFIAKKELSRIPVFGWAARRMGHVFIDRKDSSRATKAIRGRIDKGLTGAGLFFFAEGIKALRTQARPELVGDSGREGLVVKIFSTPALLAAVSAPVVMILLVEK